MKTTDEYLLMHKDIPVCAINIDNEGHLSNIRRNRAAIAHFPLGAQMNDLKLHEWWRDRAIPKTRHGVKTALQKLGYTSTNNALVNNLALSLSDCYWIKPRGSELSWSEINLFTNSFVDSFGEITMDDSYVVDIQNKTRFDCASSQGELQKKWCIDKDGRRFLVKGNYGDSYQQSLNEVFATNLHRNQKFPNYTPYYLTKLSVNDGISRQGIGCFSHNFCSEDVESISAWELLQTVKTRQNESLYYPLLNVCIGLGMREEDFTNFMDYQIMTDYLISNTDRHMNNISILRNPNTLELIGFAPIYDSGNSMFYNIPYDQLSQIHVHRITTHSFINREVDLLKYVQNETAVNLDKMDLDFSVYEKDISERHNRIPLLKELFFRKLEHLKAFQSGKRIWKNQ